MKRNITLTVCLFFITVCGYTVFGQVQDDAKFALSKADSLFEARKYTESFQIYEELLETANQSSPAMLLRMSFIKEGLGNYSAALYYLNLYYLQTADRKVLSKMAELAEQKALNGYDFSDWEFIQTIFYKYFYHLIILLIAIAILLLATMYHQRFRKSQSPIVAAITLVVVLGFLFYTLNFGKDYNKSLINENNTFVMTGPSAGAEVLAIVEKGHRVEVGGAKDVWTEVQWKGQKGFIKTDKLKPITF